MSEEKRQYYEGIGRRKRASARVRIYPGGESDGSFIVNGKDVKEYFPRYGDYRILMGPLTDTELEGKMDVTVLIEWWRCDRANRSCASWSGARAGEVR